MSASKSVCISSKSNHSIITDVATAEMICCNCGTVIYDSIEDTGQEWHAFTMEELEKRARSGGPISLARHDMGLSTIIGSSGRDASGQLLTASMRSTIERLRTWDNRIQLRHNKDRNFIRAFYQLDRLKDKLGLTNAIIEKAAYVYRKAQERGMVRGRTILGVLAAAVYIACREMQMSRTLNDIADTTSVKRKEIAKNYRMLIQELDIRIPILDPLKCIVNIANKTGISEKTKREAISIMIDFVQVERSYGKNPMGLAAVSLYMACKLTGEYKRQTDIAHKAGISDVTLRNRFKELQDKLDLNLN